ncbi:hypothetical protein E2C01_088729 [Portunus trituberculatus]|uniref:Uncharacterized protein n=1 Tax=Portunus trituberculatus TaxID=210409 RepID=A0A5B7JG85_PORTR|nr:hypothetical protein [Portunus trituberculatus]
MHHHHAIQIYHYKSYLTLTIHHSIYDEDLDSLPLQRGFPNIILRRISRQAHLGYREWESWVHRVLQGQDATSYVSEERGDV